jgi:hypothetical protein
LPTYRVVIDGTEKNAEVKSTYTDGLLQPKSLMQRKKAVQGR